MPRLSDLVPKKKFLSVPVLKQLLDGEPSVWLTIAGYAQETVGHGATAQKELLLTFKERPERLVLRPAISDVIAQSLGDELDDWPGAQVCLFIDSTVHSPDGLPTGGVRCSAVKAAHEATAKQPAAKKPAAKAAVTNGATVSY